MDKKNKDRIYLDHSATTPIDPKVLKAMMSYLQETYGNASSAHSFGQEAMAGVNKSRKILADFLNCAIDEIIFTSGATESNNLAIMGYIRRMMAVETQNLASLPQPRGIKPHIITSQIEHPAVFAVCQALEREGVEVTYAGVNKDGIVNVEEIKKSIKENTVLVSIMYVNNETGVIQPIREIGKMLKKYNKNLGNTPLIPLPAMSGTGKRGINTPAFGCRSVQALPPLDRGELGKSILPIIFHTDATQAINYCNCNVKYLHVDMLSMSGHKIYGPKGVGALYLRKGLRISPISYGGYQENGVRSGTYNTSGIVGLGRAIEIISEKENIKILKLRDKLMKDIFKKIPDVYVNGSIKNRIPSNLNFSFKNVDGESVMIMLDMNGVAVSTGSACASGSHNPSHVLTAMGVPSRLAEGSIRITLGKYNTAQEIDYFIKKLAGIVEKLRKVSPIV